MSDGLLGSWCHAACLLGPWCVAGIDGRAAGRESRSTVAYGESSWYWSSEGSGGGGLERWVLEGGGVKSQDEMHIHRYVALNRHFGWIGT